jgi:hypothetical protein
MNRPFVPDSILWEPCHFTKAPDGPQTDILNIPWLQKEETQVSALMAVYVFISSFQKIVY